MRQPPGTAQAVRIACLAMLFAFLWPATAQPQNGPVLWGTIFHVSSSGSYYTRAGDRVGLYGQSPDHRTNQWYGPFYTNDSGVYTVLNIPSQHYELHVYIAGTEVASSLVTAAGRQPPIYLRPGVR
jgi:hypothetical protein